MPRGRKKVSDAPKTPEKMTVKELKQELRTRGLDLGGKKQVLYERLLAAIEREKKKNQKNEEKKPNSLETTQPSEKTTEPSKSTTATNSSENSSPTSKNQKKNSDPSDSERSTSTNSNSEKTQTDQISNETNQGSTSENLQNSTENPENNFRELTVNASSVSTTTEHVNSKQVDESPLIHEKPKEEEKEENKSNQESNQRPESMDVDQIGSTTRVTPDSNSNLPVTSLDGSTVKDDHKKKEKSQNIDDGNRDEGDDRSGSNAARKKRRSWGSGNSKDKEVDGTSTLVSTDTLEDLGVLADLAPAKPPLKEDHRKRKSNVLEPEIPEAPIQRKLDIPPPKTPPTTTLHIKNFLRPFPTSVLKKFLSQNGEISKFWINDIKSFCYVTYADVDQAVAARNSVYGIIWPPQNKGDPLIAEFISTEEASGAAEKQTKQREEKRRKLTHDPAQSTTSTLDKLFKKTTAKPPIYYLPLTDQQVQEKKAKREAERKEREQRRREREKERERERDRDRERDRERDRDRLKDSNARK